MDINFLGFKINAKDNNALHNFFTSNLFNNPVIQKISSYDREIHIKVDIDYIYGLIVTIKNQRKYCALTTTPSGNKIIDVKNLATNSNLIEFNFFIIERKYYTGIFQHYHNSLSLSGLYEILKTNYSRHNNDLINTEIEKIPESLRKDKYLIAIRKSIKDKLEFTTAYKKEQLENLISKLDQINSFEFNIGHIGIIENSMMPLKSHTKNKSTKIIFTKGVSGGMVSAKIANAVSALSLKTGRIKGKNSIGLEETINLIDNLGKFSTFDYDESLQQIASLDISNFYNCWMVGQLKSTLIDNEIFLKGLK